mgnify:CR=1 FL=1|tara:strand:- start:623 stop:1420 length:798 start_codon:yes stop_codon:yes gene_type:complete
MKLRDLIKQIYLSSGKFYSNATADEDLKHFILKNRPRSVGKELIRIGGRGDGGYLIPNDLDGISACFSPGVAASSTFEEELADKYGIKSFMADYSVDHPPISHDLFHFEKKFLGNVNDDKFMRLEDWVNKNVSENDSSDLLLQMDIEGAEYQILVDTPRNTLNKFRIIAVEFHLLDTIFNKSAFIMMDAIFDKLNQNYTIAHIHPNNSRPILKKGSVEIPELLEITFLRNDRVLNDGKQLTFPHPLDDQCVEKRPPRHLPKCWWI